MLFFYSNFIFFASEENKICKNKFLVCSVTVLSRITFTSLFDFFPSHKIIDIHSEKVVLQRDICSLVRGTAVNMKNMLEASFPGIEVILSNYPPAFPKRLASKAVPVAQVGLVAIIVAGEHIFPRLGMVPPPWYYSLRTNRFGALASTWLLGNFLQSSLQSSGAFEVYCNGELVCVMILLYFTLFVVQAVHFLFM